MRLLTLLFPFLMLFGCAHPDYPKVLDLRTPAEHDKAYTVALVMPNDDDDGGGYYPACAGTWIGKTTILTARHCIPDDPATAMKDLTEQMLEALGADVPPELRTWTSVGPTGQLLHYVDYETYREHGTEVVYVARVARVDEKHDLAILEAFGDLPEHESTRVSTARIHDGDQLDIVGHPSGLFFTYSTGVVSAWRPMSKADPNCPCLQISSATVWHGNSGGAAFDAHGQVVGVADEIYTSVPGAALFIHRDTLKAFVDAYYQSPDLP